MRPDPAHKSLAETVRKVLPVGLKMKQVMLKKGITFAKTECPECGHWLYGRIVGRRQHMHMGCENEDCCMRMME